MEWNDKVSGLGRPAGLGRLAGWEITLRKLQPALHWYQDAKMLSGPEPIWDGPVMKESPKYEKY